MSKLFTPAQAALGATDLSSLDAVVDSAAGIPAWAEASEDDLLKFLFVSPRPCAALDRMLAHN